MLNVQFALVALHHWGSPHRELKDENGNLIPKSVNEGIRASSIYTDLTTLRNTLAPNARAYIDEALQLGLKSSPASPMQRKPESVVAHSNGLSPGATVRIDEDGTAFWNIPLTVAINVGGRLARPSPVGAPTTQPASEPIADPAIAGGREAKLQLDPDYTKRDGYQPAFLEDVMVSLPALSTARKRIAAKNLTARAGDDPYELKYYHYSVVMNGARRPSQQRSLLR